MGDTDHICVHWLSLIIKVEGFHWPLPLQCWVLEACGTSSECVQCFPFETSLLKVSFLSTAPAHHVQSFAVLYLLVSAFPHICSKCLVGMETSYPFHWVWNSFHGLYHPCVLLAPDCRDFLPFLPFCGFSILDVVHFLQSPAFCLNAAVWRLPALLSP